MKRLLRNQILCAAVVAACVGCSRTGHLYSLTIVGGGPPPITTVTDRFWGSAANYIAQFRVPVDVMGQECHEPDKVVKRQTITEIYSIYAPGHYSFCFRGPAWPLVLGLVTGLGAAVVLTGLGGSYAFRRFGYEKHEA